MPGPTKWNVFALWSAVVHWDPPSIDQEYPVSLMKLPEIDKTSILVLMMF